MNDIVRERERGRGRQANLIQYMGILIVEIYWCYIGGLFR